ncbi:Thiosulfate sulfurtransferase GlpE [Ralstonia condita]|uniref:Thiosulfate sulfurtransferase GlpE n=1 Tax=Ralstonia condita TaxID=3058600 RepID=A0ABM9JJT8_9RALS|nr:rhodanese-like domain-containing protein [Ralstonia sp. LMG 7141]MDE2202963.1 rhodanese-like domain-containing protein [Burkholderiaceae bacterium]CAJ0796116.1 Thiosulfate sulfurtransferase GlpE [Ralstonia sp. LMG 7141]
MKFFADYNNLALLAVAIVSGGLLVWSSVQRRIAGGGGAKLSASAATQLINRRNAIVVDVRESGEYAAGHLPQAKHAPLGELEGKAGSLAKNKETPIILVCQTGQRAGRAQAVLKRAGYSEVYSLEGGLAAWQQAGLPVVK